jgi:hypothetical protein
MKFATLSMFAAVSVNAVTQAVEAETYLKCALPNAYVMAQYTKESKASTFDANLKAMPAKITAAKAELAKDRASKTSSLFI